MNSTTLKPKPLKDLTLLDKFLFDETMENSDVYEDVLQIILEDDHLRLLTEPETEKELRTVPWLRSIRMDVFRPLIFLTGNVTATHSSLAAKRIKRWS